MSEIEDILDTDLASIAGRLAEFLSGLDKANPGWMRVEITRQTDGEAKVVVFDGSDEPLH